MSKSLWQRHVQGDPSQWWTENLSEETLPDFLKQIKGPDREQSIAFRAYLKRVQAISVLDCGGGPLVDWAGCRAELPGMRYAVMDSAPYFKDLAKENGAEFKMGNIEAIPYRKRSFDLVYARHVLLHLRYYETAVKEMVRVARRFVYISMPIAPGAKDKIRKHRLGVWSNVYGKAKITAFCSSLPDVEKVWCRDKVLILIKENR